MENMNLLEKFANPEIIHSLTFGEKMLATFYTTVLGMMITFIALIVIWIMTIILSKVVRLIEAKAKDNVVAVKEVPQSIQKVELVKDDEEELIAVITAAIAASMETSIHNILVTNIVRINDATPSWGTAGRSELMNSRF